MKKHRDIRSVRFGFNPNSSSLGADVTGLLLGAGACDAHRDRRRRLDSTLREFGGATPHGVDTK